MDQEACVAGHSDALPVTCSVPSLNRYYSFLGRKRFWMCSPNKITWAAKELTGLFFYTLSPLVLSKFMVVLKAEPAECFVSGWVLPCPPLCLHSHSHLPLLLSTHQAYPVNSSHILHPFENEGLQFTKAVETTTVLHSKCNSIGTTWALVRNSGYQTLLQTYCIRICTFIRYQGDLFAHWCLRSAILNPCVGLVLPHLCSVKTLPPLWVSASSYVRWVI